MLADLVHDVVENGLLMAREEREESTTEVYLFEKRLYKVVIHETAWTPVMEFDDLATDELDEVLEAPRAVFDMLEFVYTNWHRVLEEPERAHCIQ